MNGSLKKSINIAELKAKLSKYLRLVKSGEEIIILDHKMPVAKISSINRDEENALDTIKAKDSFSLLASLKVEPLSEKPKIDILTLLQDERGSR